MNTSSEKICQQKKIKKDTTFVFKKEIAKKYGVEAAILIQHFQYAIDNHKRKGSHFYERRYWTYDSVNNLTNLYPFWSTETIRRLINNLIDKKVLITGNFNKHKYDRTRWFAFRDEDKFIHRHDAENPPNFSNFSIDVDESVDKSENPVDNPVDKNGIKNSDKNKKSSGNEPFLSSNYPENRRNGHLLKPTNAFVESNTPIPIYTSIYSSIEEEGTNNNNNGGKLKKYDLRKNTGDKPPFVNKITNGYTLPYSLRRKLHELGYDDDDIDKEIINLIRYHQENPQNILNEHSCVLGWFKKSLKDVKK